MIDCKPIVNTGVALRQDVLRPRLGRAIEARCSQTEHGRLGKVFETVGCLRNTPAGTQHYPVIQDQATEVQTTTTTINYCNYCKQLQLPFNLKPKMNCIQATNRHS